MDGPSFSLSSKNPFTSLSHGTHVGAVAPSALVTEHFAAERAEDLQKLLANVELPVPARHLRRRARSWRPFGLVRLRVKQPESRKVKHRTLPTDGKIPVATRMAAEKQDWRRSDTSSAKTLEKTSIAFASACLGATKCCRLVAVQVFGNTRLACQAFSHGKYMGPSLSLPEQCLGKAGFGQSSGKVLLCA